MDPQRDLEQMAGSLSLPLTPLLHITTFSQSQKVQCCGGVVTKLVAESSEDSCVQLQDSSGTVSCAVHGEVTALYPGILAPGAAIVLTNVTVVIISPSIPPLLVCCLPNLSRMMLPDGQQQDGCGQVVVPTSGNYCTDLSCAASEQTSSKPLIDEQTVLVLNPTLQPSNPTFLAQEIGGFPEVASLPLPQIQGPVTAMPHIRSEQSHADGAMLLSDDEDCLELADL